jgi:imidazolonepropionase-like amidohydrolase
MALHVRGVILPDDEVRDLWLIEDRVTFERVPGAVTLSDGGYVLPGLVDAHCHIGIRPGGDPIGSADEARALAEIDRNAGVLAIRDAGSPYPYSELDDEPGMPRLARAGRHVAPVRRYLKGIGVEVTPGDVAATISEQATAGNGWVKLVADWIERDAGDLAPAWDVDVMAGAVAAAHAAGARITVHAFAEASVAALVRAGVDCVEHGTGLSEEDIDEMVRRGTALVPTMLNVATFDTIAGQAEGKFPLYAGHMRRLRERFPTVVRSAYEAGVPIYVGTDAGGGIGHGMAAAEIQLLHEQGGLSIMDALAAGSWAARSFLGFPGLVEGGLADLVVYDEDPRRDLRVLGQPRFIVLRGQPIV